MENNVKMFLLHIHLSYATVWFKLLLKQIKQ